MPTLTDTAGVTLPESETPTDARLRAYGDFLFLAFRSDWHQRMTMANLRSAFETPIALDQYRIFRFDGVPRGLITWAWMNAEAERKYVSGDLLDPADWHSGDRLWLIDMIAPYKGLAGWCPKPRFLRVLGERAGSATRDLAAVCNRPQSRATTGRGAAMQPA